MDNLKNSEPTTKSKKFNSKQNKLTNKFGTGINDKRNFENIISDINLDLMKINKKLEKHSDYQEHIQSILEEEIKLRQDVEKKTFLMNENLNSEITKMKFNISNFTQTINETLKETLKKINDENQKGKTNLNEKNEEINKKMNEYELKIKKNQEEKSLKLMELEERIKLIEENNLNQFQNLQKNNMTNMQELNNIKNLVKNNNILINDEINIIKKDITYIKNEIQALKGSKVNMDSDLNKLLKQIEYLNQKFEKTINDLNNTKIEIQTKINNYESANRLFQQNFSDIKENLLSHLDEMNNINKEDIIKIKDETFDQIKKIKNDMNQFNLNIIKENQKFIDYSQNQLQEHDDNLKKLFELTTDDIEVLKKKSDTLESLLKNTRNEMINNINSVEGFLTNRYDSIFKSFSSDRNINKF
jgi:chromosome segregation ATPase